MTRAAPALPFDVRGTDRNWAVMQGSTIIRSLNCDRDHALGVADKLTRTARITTRHCLNCVLPFQSQGPHHRLCQTCRNAA